jgi:hypothetical protein
MTVEGDMQARIRIALGKWAPHARLFRNNRGVFWAGKLVQNQAGLVVLAQARKVECGLTPGASDLVGLTTITITPDMVGQRLAVFTAGEVKRPGVGVPEHQQKFVDFVRAAGGFADVIRSEDDAVRLVTR